MLAYGWPSYSTCWGQNGMLNLSSLDWRTKSWKGRIFGLAKWSLEKDVLCLDKIMRQWNTGLTYGQLLHCKMPSSSLVNWGRGQVGTCCVEGLDTNFFSSKDYWQTGFGIASSCEQTGKVFLLKVELDLVNIRLLKDDWVLYEELELLEGWLSSNEIWASFAFSWMLAIVVKLRETSNCLRA